MYNGNAVMQTAEGQQPITIGIIASFEKQNAAHHELVSMIQDRLHSIVNNRVPEEPQKGETRPMDNSFADAMNTNLSRMQTTTSRLEQILKHLQQIV
jgi:hypothetical protein